MALLQLKNLTVRFGGLTAVEKVSCAVDREQIFSIIGPNGAGKTTVFNAITGLYKPTEGSIEFQGRKLERPLTGQVIAWCLAIGLLTGLAAALISMDVNALWRATIKRNYAGPGQPFSYRDAWNDAVAYFQGHLAIERMRGDRWAVRTADGRNTLAYARGAEEAEALRVRYEKLLSVAASPDAVVERDGRWVVPDPDGGEDLATFDSQADAQAVLDSYAELQRHSAVRRRNAAVALVLGFAIGSAGAWSMWNRSRSTPEVIARAGIARTFQNIRLFQNMTVRDNVLTAMDRGLQGGIFRIALNLPSVKYREVAAQRGARGILRSVGLEGREDMVAKNLPYGDQRRLEIARALACAPQLILLDEPAAGMNPSESGELIRLIEQLRGQGITILLIEHHMKVVMGISDRVAVLEYGRKIAEGAPEEVRANPLVIAAYLGSEEVG